MKNNTNLKKPTVLYHATDYKNLGSILVNGLVSHLEGVFLADTPINALKFVALRGIPKILVVEVSLENLDVNLLSESHDHYEGLFDCKAWIYTDSISDKHLTNYTQFDNPLLKMKENS